MWARSALLACQLGFPKPRGRTCFATRSRFMGAASRSSCAGETMLSTSTTCKSVGGAQPNSGGGGGGLQQPLCLALSHGEAETELDDGRLEWAYAPRPRAPCRKRSLRPTPAARRYRRAATPTPSLPARPSRPRRRRPCRSAPPRPRPLRARAPAVAVEPFRHRASPLPPRVRPRRHPDECPCVVRV